jgi:hypothetical protein
MARISKFLRLPPERRRLLLASIALIATVRILLRLLPFDWVRKMLDRAARRPSEHTTAGAIEAVTWAIEVASHLVPTGTHCLTMALVAQLLLVRRGCPATLHFGIPRQPATAFVAHAWVVSNGVVVSGGPDVERKYIELAP